MQLSKFSLALFAFTAGLIVAVNCQAQDVDQARMKCVEFGFKDKTPSHDNCMKQFLQSTGLANGSNTLPEPRVTSASAGQPEENFWLDAKRVGNKEAYEAFLQSYPKGRYAGMAKANLAKLAGETSSQQRASIEIETDIFKVVFDKNGGSVVRTEFLKMPPTMDPPKNLVLLDHSQDRVYLAQTGLIGYTTSAFPNHQTIMNFSGDRVMQDGTNELSVQFESPVIGGIKLIKTYIFRRGSYVVLVKHKIFNFSRSQVSPSLYLQLVRDGNSEALDQRSKFATFTGPAIYTDTKKYQRVEFRDIEKNRAVLERDSSSGYVAIVQHYFASAWLLGDGVARENFVRKVDTNLYSVGMIAKLKNIAPGDSFTAEARLFMGPRVESVTTPLQLEAMQDDGWLLNSLKKSKP
jgi:YidC/Oxa1 family membrane protein insertase